VCGDRRWRGDAAASEAGGKEEEIEGGGEIISLQRGASAFKTTSRREEPEKGRNIHPSKRPPSLSFAFSWPTRSSSRSFCPGILAATDLGSALASPFPSSSSSFPSHKSSLPLSSLFLHSATSIFSSSLPPSSFPVKMIAALYPHVIFINLASSLAPGPSKLADTITTSGSLRASCSIPIKASRAASTTN